MFRLPQKVFFLCVFFLHSIYVQAQIDDLKFEHLDAIPQLANRSITSFAKDPKGYLWFGTQDGLLRFDGYSINTYKHDLENENSLSDNNIRALATDTLGNLWIATQGGGLNKLILSEERFVRFEHNSEDKTSISGNAVWSLLLDSNHNLWAGTWSNGLNRLNISTGKFEHYAAETNDPVLAIYEDDDGKIWFSAEGLNTYHPETGEIHTDRADPSNPNRLSSNHIRAITSDKEGNLWIGTEDGGINKLSRSSNTFERFMPDDSSAYSLSSLSIYNLHVDENNIMWIATNKGLDIWDLATNRIKNYRNIATDPYSLSNDNPRIIFDEGNGSVWIGNEGGRVNKLLDKKNFSLYRNDPFNENSLSNNVIRSLFEDTDGKIWIGTQGGGLNILDRNNGNVYRYPSDSSQGLYVGSMGVSAMYRDSNDIMWVGTWGEGLYRLDESAESVLILEHEVGNSNSLPDNRIQLLYEDNSGVFWVGTENGLSAYDDVTGQWRPFKGLNGNTVQGKAFLEDQEGNLWIGTWNGLNKINKDRQVVEQWSLEDDPNSLSSEHIISLHLDNDNKLWVGTFGGGLNKLDISTNKITRYMEKDGLPNSVVYGILSDDQGHLWLSTNNGLSRFDPNTEKFRNYDATEGLQGNEFYWGASFKNKDGSLMFGGINGLNIFQSGEIKDNQTIPPVVVSDFQIFNKAVGIGADSVLSKSISYTSSINLSYKQSVLTFNFSSLNYNHPEKNQYAYMLEDFDEKWNYVGNRRTATYTNLDPGDYTFKVKASNNDNIWNEKGVSIELSISPPFWRTWWFYMFCIVLSGTLIYSFIKYRERQLNFDKAELQKSIDTANAQVEEQKRNIAEQREREKDRIWTDQGLVKFGEILSNKDDIDDLCHNVLKNLVTYLEIEVAAIYLESENDDREIELLQRSSFGYSNEEPITIGVGEGLVGECYVDRQQHYIDNLPEGYLKIASGLGDCSPASLFLVPLTYQGTIIGVMEMASFGPISELKRDFICTFTARLTAAINTRLLGEKTQKLLDDSKVKAKELAVREEELQQNLEELQAMNEDRDRKTRELEENVIELKKENEKLKKATAQ